jgi:protein subunit release factor A
VTLDPTDLTVDLILRKDRAVCAVRITHVPTGTSATVDDCPTVEANKEAALALLAEAIERRETS